MKITQNQYFNKSKSLNRGNKFNIPYEPNYEAKYTCDISNGYIQSKNLSLFQGVSEELEFVIVTKFDFSRFPTTYSTQ